MLFELETYGLLPQFNPFQPNWPAKNTNVKQLYWKVYWKAFSD